MKATVSVVCAALIAVSPAVGNSPLQQVRIRQEALKCLVENMKLFVMVTEPLIIIDLRQCPPTLIKSLEDLAVVNNHIPGNEIVQTGPASSDNLLIVLQEKLGCYLEVVRTVQSSEAIVTVDFGKCG